MKYPTWKDFESKYPNYQEIAFEALARMLFRYKYGLGDALPYFKNHAGNETETISFEGEVIGFQAKYFDKEINADKIEHSIKTAHSHNPNQTKMILYTNLEFGNPRKEGDTKTEKQKNIEKVAKACNIQLEWMYGDNILDAVLKNELTYNVFFNPESHLQHILDDVLEYNESQLSYIKNHVITSKGVYEFDRSLPTDKLTSLIVSKKNVFLFGESGSGKTAVFKKFYELYKDNRNYIFFILNAGQLNAGDLNSLFRLHHDYTFSEFYTYFASVENRLLVIDSAEQLLDLNNRRVALMLFDKLKKEGWNFILTCKSNSRDDLQNMMKEDFQLDFEFIPLASLQDYELKKFEKETGVRLPLDEKFLSQLSIPFYLARYCEINLGEDRASVFRDKVWKQKVRKYSSDGRKNEASLFEIVKRKQETGLFIIPIEGISSESIDNLLNEDVIGEIEHRGVFIKHDLYADWALDYMLQSELSDKTTIEDKLTSKPSIGYANAFRRWLKEKLDNKDSIVESIIGIMLEKSIDGRWIQIIFEVIGASESYATTFIERYKDKLVENDYYWFNIFVDNLCVSCRIVSQYIPYKNGIRIPITHSVGSGWEAAITLIDNVKEDYYLNNLSSVYNILNGFTSKKKKTPEIARIAGLLSLRIFDIQANPQQEEIFIWQLNMKDWAALVCKYSLYIQDELKEILKNVVRNDWSHHNSPYHDIVQYLTTPQNTFVDINAYYVCREDLLPVLKLFWTESGNNEDFYSRIGTEWEFGINKGCGGGNGYFPPSPYQTPILGMLNTESIMSVDDMTTLDFIIEFVDVCVSCFKKRGRSLQAVDEVKVLFEDGTLNVVLCSSALWNMYRGSSGIAVPNLLESIHMALEKFLLDQLEGEQKTRNVEKIKTILWRILKRSHSASLYAIVASVILAHYDDYFDIFLFLLQDMRFLQLDLHRQISEYHVKSLSFVYMRYPDFAQERKNSADMKHRTLHLENLLTNLQVVYENSTKDEEKVRLNQLYSCVDKLIEAHKSIKKAVCSDEPYIIERINVRKWEKTDVKLDNGVEATQYTPVFPQKLIKEKEKTERTSNEQMLGMNIIVWAEKMLQGDIERAKIYSFHDKPKDILKIIAAAEKSLERNEFFLGMSMGKEFVPYIGSAALLIYYRHELSQTEIDTCSKKVAEALCSPDFLLSGLLTGFATLLEAIPALIALYPNEKEGIADIILQYAKRRKEVGNFRSCDKIRKLVVKHNLWVTEREFMDFLLNRLLESLKLDRIEEISLNDAETVLSILTELPINRSLANICLKKLSEHWDNIGFDSLDYSNRIYDSDFIASYLMNAPETEIQELAAIFGECMAKKQDHESILSSILLDCIYSDKYDQFWKIWYALFPSLVKSAILLDSTTTMDYLLCPSFLQESSKDWFKFKKDDIAFFEKVVDSVGCDEDVLFCVLKVFITIAEDFQVNALSLIYKLTRVKLPSWSRMKNAIINYMDMYVDSINTKHRSQVIYDKDLYNQYCGVLEYMKDNNSNTAARILKTL